MKPVILVGKGPSAQEVPASDGYIVAAVNNATMFCEKVDYLFIQDVEILDVMGPEDFAKAAVAVVPTHPYKEHCQLKHLTHLEMIKQMSGISQFCIYQPRLENPDIQPVEGIEHFPDIYSGGDAAVAWLIARGFREFYFVGIDPAGGYHKRVQEAGAPLEARKEMSIECPHCHENFEATVTMAHHAHNPKRQRWFQLQYQSLTRKIQSVGGTFYHLNPGEPMPGALAAS